MQILVTFKDDAAAALAALREGLGDGEALHASMALGVENAIRAHLDEAGYTTRRNRLGATSTGWWKGVSRSIASVATETEATVSLTQRGIALQYYGGTVVPTEAKALSVPVHKSAHGVYAREYPGLLAYIPAGAQFGPFRKGGGQDTIGYLVRGETYTRTRGKNKGKEGVRALGKDRGGEIIYVLRASTYHEGDKNILPTEDKLAAAAAASGAAYLDSPSAS